MPQSNDEFKTLSLSKKHIYYLTLYSVVMAGLASIALILLVAHAPYLPAEKDAVISSLLAAQWAQWGVVAMLATVLVAGIAGGALCNLRGLFKYHQRSLMGSFPTRLELPFYIRPLTGAVTGLLTFFTMHLIVTTLSASNGEWRSLSGRIAYIAVAILAGFASQEFMQRLKEVAITMFSESAQNPQEKLFARLRELYMLRESGVLSEQEFIKLKDETIREWEKEVPG